MSKVKDGGPAFPCSRCGASVIFKAAWQKKDRRCLQCKRKEQNAANKAKGQQLLDESKAAYKRRKDWYAAYWQEQRENPEHLIKRAARRKVATEIEAGRLKRQPCQKCGTAKSDAHHHDYSKPLDIKWLCRRCHFQEDHHGRHSQSM